MSNLSSSPGQPTPGAAAGPRPGTPATIDIFADKGANGGICFSHEWRFENGPASKGHMQVPRKRRVEPGTPTHFRLHDRSGTGLKFEAQVADAIWVQENSCPCDAQHDPEFDLRNARRQDRLLSVVNLNQRACELHYRLNFRDSAGKAVCYDPIIRNGGSV